MCHIDAKPVILRFYGRYGTSSRFSVIPYFTGLLGRWYLLHIKQKEFLWHCVTLKKSKIIRNHFIVFSLHWKLGYGIAPKSLLPGSFGKYISSGRFHAHQGHCRRMMKNMNDVFACEDTRREQKRLNRLIQSCGIPPAYRGKTFDDYIVSEGAERAVKVARWLCEFK